LSGGDVLSKHEETRFFMIATKTNGADAAPQGGSIWIRSLLYCGTVISLSVDLGISIAMFGSTLTDQKITFLDIAGLVALIAPFSPGFLLFKKLRTSASDILLTLIILNILKIIYVLINSIKY